MTDFTRAHSAEQPTGHSILCAAHETFGVPAHRMHYWQWIPQSGRRAKHILLGVHGLSRQGLDFAALAEYLSREHDVWVIAPDVAGRGQSEWLPQAAHYQPLVYAADIGQLLQEIRSSLSQPLPLTFLGTSMGGLIALVLSASQPDLCDRLILNDIGPRIEWQALARIADYIGDEPHFVNETDALAYLQTITESFGQLSAEQRQRLNRPQLRRNPDHTWRLHYDPKIGQSSQSVTPEQAAQTEAMLWPLYDGLRMPTYLLRGGDSDLISAATAEEMHTRGPKAQVFTVLGCGHAPALQTPEQWRIIETCMGLPHKA